jgi:hypothetical protein
MLSPLLVRPCLSLLEYWQVKLPLALIAAWAWWAAERLIGLYDQLLSTDPLLLLMAISIFLLDWITGVASALRNGDPIRSWKFRQGAWKFLEYAAVVSVSVMLANGAVGTIMEPIFGMVDDAALFYIAGTEALSVVENVKGSRAAALRWLRKVRKVASGQWPDQNDPASK